MQPEVQSEPTDRERARQRRAEQVQRRRLALGICVLALLVLVLILVIACPGGNETATTTTEPEDTTNVSLISATYTAELTGDQSVPPVRTAATGLLTLTYDEETEELSYVLEVTHSITNPSSAVIYEGAPGTSGTAVYTLFAGPMKEGTFVGTLAEGVIYDEDLIGPLRGGTVADLIALIKEGNAYVSIGNKSHPVDAIRGQISY
ncbi:MAG: CHRD domain-containing protein [Actinomycetia bacterium]|nr:CHRD domain-containing protein [Actinomycetes bacterium]